MATVIRGDDNFDTADAGKVLQVVESSNATNITFSQTHATSATTVPLQMHRLRLKTYLLAWLTRL